MHVVLFGDSVLEQLRESSRVVHEREMAAEMFQSASIMVDELSEKEQEQLAIADKGANPERAKDWWKIWVRDRIFIRNDWGKAVKVVVHRFYKVAELQKFASDAGIDMGGGGSLGLTLEWALKDGHTQEKVVEDGKISPVDLGGGAGGGYVSVFVNGPEYQTVLCKDNYVKPRYMLRLTPGSVLE